MKLISILFVFCIFPISITAQNEEKYACREEDKKVVREYFDNYHENEKLLFEFYKYFIEPSAGKTRLPFCWHGCAVSLVKPVFPRFAREKKMTASVEVETIADENGKIILARANTKKNSIFRRNAELAACNSQFKPIIFEGKPIKFRWKIVYHFVN
jgi:hypothetical protein